VKEIVIMLTGFFTHKTQKLGNFKIIMPLSFSIVNPFYAFVLLLAVILLNIVKQYWYAKRQTKN